MVWTRKENASSRAELGCPALWRLGSHRGSFPGPLLAMGGPDRSHSGFSWTQAQRVGQQGRSHWLLKGPSGSGIKPRENKVGRRAGRAQRTKRVTPDHLQFKHIVQQPCLGWQQGPSLACFPHNTSLFCTPPFLEKALLQETWPWAAYIGTQVLNAKPSRREPS